MIIITLIFKVPYVQLFTILICIYSVLFQLLVLCLFMIVTTSFVLPNHSQNENQACSTSRFLNNKQNHIKITECNIDTNSSNIADLSVCPWDQFIDVDVERLPREIPFAKCRCSKGSAGLFRTQSVCQPVYTTMSVWKKNIQSDQYHQMWLHVPIACACSLPSLL